MAAKPEAGFQQQVVNLGHLFGWHIAHFTQAQIRPGVCVTPAKADGKGFPDLVMVRERIVYAELKMPGNDLSPEQSKWQAKILGAGGEFYVWRPADLDSIHHILQQRRPTASTVTLPK